MSCIGGGGHRREVCGPFGTAGRRELGKTEIENFGVTTLGCKDIRGLDVTMNDSSGVSRIKCVRNLKS